jgi:hypothetical protein
MADGRVTRTIKKKKGPGRPFGSVNKETLLRQALAEKSEGVILRHFPKIVKAVCDRAEKGDMRAAKMIMDRIIPVRRATDQDGERENKGITIVVQAATKIAALSEKVIEVTTEKLNGEEVTAIEHQD